jgi:hypothetical protein
MKLKEKVEIWLINWLPKVTGLDQLAIL